MLAELPKNPSSPTLRAWTHAESLPGVLTKRNRNGRFLQKSSAMVAIPPRSAPHRLPPKASPRLERARGYRHFSARSSSPGAAAPARRRPGAAAPCRPPRAAPLRAAGSAAKRSRRCPPRSRRRPSSTGGARRGHGQTVCSQGPGRRRAAGAPGAARWTFAKARRAAAAAGPYPELSSGKVNILHLGNTQLTGTANTVPGDSQAAPSAHVKIHPLVAFKHPT